MKSETSFSQPSNRGNTRSRSDLSGLQEPGAAGPGSDRFRTSLRPGICSSKSASRRNGSQSLPKRLRFRRPAKSVPPCSTIDSSTLLSARGRDYMQMLKTLPGVTYDGGGGAGSLGTSDAPIISGIKSDYVSMSRGRSRGQQSRLGHDRKHDQPRRDCRGQGPDGQLPGRVRQERRSDRQRRDQERHAELSRDRVLVQTPRDVQREELGRKPGRSRKRPLSVQHHGGQHRRSDLLWRLQPRKRQTLLLLLDGSPAEHRPVKTDLSGFPRRSSGTAIFHSPSSRSQWVPQPLPRRSRSRTP